MIDKRESEIFPSSQRIYVYQKRPQLEFDLQDITFLRVHIWTSVDSVGRWTRISAILMNKNLDFPESSDRNAVAIMLRHNSNSFISEPERIISGITKVMAASHSPTA
jgi:hypothetical protein